MIENATLKTKVAALARPNPRTREQTEFESGRGWVDNGGANTAPASTASRNSPRMDGADQPQSGASTRRAGQAADRDVTSAAPTRSGSGSRS